MEKVGGRCDSGNFIWDLILSPDYLVNILWLENSTSVLTMTFSLKKGGTCTRQQLLYSLSRMFREQTPGANGAGTISCCCIDAASRHLAQAGTRAIRRCDMTLVCSLLKLERKGQNTSPQVTNSDDQLTSAGQPGPTRANQRLTTGGGFSTVSATVSLF
jgi:hypothetical protein